MTALGMVPPARGAFLRRPLLQGSEEHHREGVHFLDPATSSRLSTGPRRRSTASSSRARKTLDFVDYRFRVLEPGGNLSLIESEQNVTEKDSSIIPGPDLLGDTRPLADQSPYIINLDLTYDNPRLGHHAFVQLQHFWAASAHCQSQLAGHLRAARRAVRCGSLPAHRTALAPEVAARNLLDPEIKRTYGRRC